MTKVSHWLFTATLLSASAIAQDARPLGDVARDYRDHKLSVSSTVLEAQGTESNYVTPGQPPQVDQPRSAREEKPQPRIVPAGTQIKIDLFNHNVAWPVREGFAEMIPALAVISFESKPVYFERYRGQIESVPQKRVRLTSITIAGTSYTVVSDAVVVPETEREITVTLRRPLTLDR